LIKYRVGFRTKNKLMSPMEGRRPLPRAVLKHKLVVEDKDKKPHELCDLSTWNDDSVGVKHGVSQTLYVKSHAYTKRSTVMSFKRFRLTLSEGADKRAVLPFMERLRSKKEAGVILLNRRGWVGYLVPHPESAKIYCHYHYQEAMDQKPKILDGLKQPQQDKQLVTSKRDLSPSMPKISTSGEITVKGYGEVVPYDPGHMYTVLELDPYQGQPPPFPMGRVPPLPDPYSGGEENCLQGSVGAVNASHAHQSVDGAQEQHQGMRDSAQAEAALKYGDELRTASEQAHSLIYHLKRFNNWVKITLIAKASKDPARGKEAGLRVLDLACGKGGDLGKWAVHPHKLERYVASDIAYGSLLHLLERMKKGKWHRGGSVILFEADLGRHDVQKDTLKVWRGSSTSENMEGKWESAVPLVEGDVFDVVSMQFALHYMAQSEKRMRHFLAEVSRRLRPEGLFIATTMDSRVLIRLLMGHAQESWDPTRGKSPLSVHINDERDQHLLSITFTDPRECYVRQESEESDNRGPFGLEYRFILRETELNKNAVDDIPEWMIPIEVLKDLAMEYGLEMVTAENFHDYYTNEIQNSKSKKLLSAMHVFNPEGTINATEWRIVGE
ncbi:unnamed protein product, partial [Discosporangium mesarthrocarpum]